MKRFTITIGQRGSPRLSFESMAECSAIAIAQHIELAQAGERMECKALDAWDERALELVRSKQEAALAALAGAI